MHDRAAGLSLAFKRAREQAAAASPATAEERQPLVPWFLWLFVALVAVNSAGALTAPLQQGPSWVSRACLVVAIAALGMKTSLTHLAEAGWRPILLILVETLWMAALVLGVIASRLQRCQWTGVRSHRQTRISPRPRHSLQWGC